MASPEEQERRIEQGEKECKAGPLAMFTLGLLRKRLPDEEGPQTVATHIYGKDWEVLEAAAKQLIKGPWQIAELLTPSGILCRTYKPEVK